MTKVKFMVFLQRLHDERLRVGADVHVRGMLWPDYQMFRLESVEEESGYWPQKLENIRRGELLREIGVNNGVIPEQK